MQTSAKVPLCLSLITLTLTACVTKVPGQNYHLSDNGYATVISAPHSKLTQQQREELESRKDSSSFKPPAEYYQFKEEAQKLRDILREKEPDNFTEFRYEWEPEFRHLFSFKRDPQQTLARYTSNPIFESGIQRHMRSFLEAKEKEIWNVLAPDGKVFALDVINPSGQINMMKGVVEISTGAYEDKFFGLPNLETYRNDPDIEFTFLERRPSHEIIDPRISSHIKLFLRDNTEGEEVVFASQTGTIQLRNGCFFFKEKGALILFPESSNLGLDQDGYIIIYNGPDYITRVGEKMRYYTGAVPVVKPDLADQLQDACGQYPVVKINDPKSDYIAQKLDEY